MYSTRAAKYEPGLTCNNSTIAHFVMITVYYSVFNNERTASVKSSLNEYMSIIYEYISETC